MKKVSTLTAGFTLIEVILAISILSTLTILSTQALSRALKAKTKIQAEVTDVSGLRDSMRMMRTDLYLAYHYRDIQKEIQEAYKKLQTPAANNQSPIPPLPQSQQLAPPPPEAPPIDPSTHFIGTEEKMNFSTMNNSQISTAVVQADFIEVGYFLKDCKGLSHEKTSKCLFRRTQMILDDDPEAGGTEMVMLENVTEFKLRYIGANKTEWSSQWSSKGGLDASSKNKFPDAVEITLGIERELEGKKKSYSMQFVVPIHFVNNPPTQSGSSMSAPASPLGGG